MSGVGVKKAHAYLCSSPEKLKVDKKVQDHQTLVTLERHWVKNDGKNAIISPSNDSPQAVGDSRDVNENNLGKDTEQQETVRYDSSLVPRKINEPQYGNDEIYFEDNACNDQSESEYEAAEVKTDHISNVKEEYENTKILEEGIKNTDALSQEKETVDHEYAMDEISEPELDTIKPVHIETNNQYENCAPSCN